MNNARKHAFHFINWMSRTFFASRLSYAHIEAFLFNNSFRKFFNLLHVHFDIWRGQEITRTLEIPLVAYMGDTLPGAHLVRNDVRKAELIICECTFFEPEHTERAKVGMHMHINDIAEWLRVVECKAMILTHISRRTHLGYARERLIEIIGQERAKNVFLLMDGKFNRERYEQQEAAAGIVHPPKGTAGAGKR